MRFVVLVSILLGAGCGAEPPQYESCEEGLGALTHELRECTGDPLAQPFEVSASLCSACITARDDPDTMRYDCGEGERWQSRISPICDGAEHLCCP